MIMIKWRSFGLNKNVMIGLSGGPSVAINSSLAGVLQAATASCNIGKVYGARNGIKGVLDDNIIDLNPYSDKTNLALLMQTPAMALGSCRYKLSSNEFSDIIKVFKKYEIGYFFYIGGNDSMDTVAKLNEYCKANKYEIKIVGVPKTIDNDLPITDHTPGFGSAAKYLYTTVSEIIRDSEIYPVQNVVIVEVMGRDSGWLTLAAGLPKFLGKSSPDIIAIPEVAFDENEFIEKVKTIQKTKQTVVCVVSEGIRNASGEYVGNDTKSGKIDTFGHCYLSGVGKYLEQLIGHKIGCKVRSIELSVLQRCASHLASKTDIDEGFLVGQQAVASALRGDTGVMMIIKRVSDSPYHIEIATTDVKNVANKAKDIPEKWFDLEDVNIYNQISSYLLPLISGELVQILDSTGLPIYIDIK